MSHHSKLSSIKVSYKNEFHIIAPIPSFFSVLLDSIKETIPGVPKIPNICYIDDEGDKIKISNDKGYEFFLATFESTVTPKLYIEDDQKLLDAILPIKRPFKEETKSAPNKLTKLEDLEDLAEPFKVQPNFISSINHIKMSSKPNKFARDFEKVILDNFDGGPIKIEPAAIALSPILESEANSFILDIEGKARVPNWSGYTTYTEFFAVVRESIRSSIDNYGFIQASIVYKIPIELCIHILYDTKVHVESEREAQKYKKYVEACLPKEPSLFTPKFCCNLIQQLVHGALNKQHIMTTYGVEEESIELWLRLFSCPKKPRPLYDTFPKTFKVQLVRDYLEGNYDAENIKMCWDLEKEMVENWIYAELEEKEEIVMPTARRRLGRGEKEEIVDKFLQKKMTYKEIKTKYGVNQSEVEKWIAARKNGTKLRDPYHGHRSSTIMDQAYKFLEFSS